MVDEMLNVLLVSTVLIELHIKTSPKSHSI